MPRVENWPIARRTILDHIARVSARIGNGMRVSGSFFFSAISVLGALCVAAPVSAQQGAEEDLKGVYAPLELRHGEPNDLIDTAAQYQGMFERRSLLYNDPAVVAMVRRIGHELAPPPTDDYINYEFFVIRDPSPNAFAFPNGQIYVHTGMLARMGDESELAALLAHEINHAAGHHTILSHRITAKRLAIGVFGGALGSLMGQLRYSRQLEQEADDRAARLMQDTPYDPHAMTDLLEILNRDFEGLDPRYASVWTTHPDPVQRIEASRQNVAGLPHKPRDPQTYDAVMYPLRILTVRDYIQDDYPYTAMAVAERLMQRYPDDLDFLMAIGDALRVLGPRPEALPDDFERSDARRNLRDRIRLSRGQRMERLLETPEGLAAMAANLEHAEATYQSILEIDPGYTPAYRGLGEVYEARHEDREAAKAYLTYVQQQPDAPDRPVIMGRLTAIRDRLMKEDTDDE
jgi:predicted Zn-dependent protease